MKSIRFALVSLLFAPLFAGAAIDLESIKPDGFARGVAFTVNGYTNASGAARSPLTDFPVLVRISEAGLSGFDYDDVYSHTDNNNNKTIPHIAFTDAEGNKLAYDVDTWNNSSTSLVWTTLPVMTNGTQFAMFWRAAQGAAEAAAGGNAFTNYVGVWHLGETGSGNSSTKVFDSSGNGLTGTATGDKCLSVAASEGVLGGSWRFNDEYNRNASGILVDFNDQTKLDAVNALGTDFTVSFWMKPYGTIAKKEGVCWNALIGRKTDGKSNYWGLQLDEDPKNLRVFGSNSSSFTSASSYSFSQNNWYKIDVAFYKDATNKGKFCYYVNGASKETDRGMSGDKAAAQGSGPLGIGNFTSLSAERCFWGAMDEVRLVCGTNSADRVAADYATVATPSFLGRSEVVEFAEDPKPVIGHTISDIGAAFVQFSGSVSEMGEGATAASILLKVWPTEDSEPANWTTNATGLAKGASFSAMLTGLEPLKDYTYLIKAVNDLAEPYDSDVASGTFTTSGVGDAGTGGAVERQLDEFVHIFLVSERGQTVYEFTPPNDVSKVDALVVAGGGPGGYYAGGGGGAGGVIYQEALTVSGGQTYTITVGTGGVASVSATVYGSNGGNSSIVGPQVDLVAVGGGAGGNGRLNEQATTRAGVAGGSGGGSSWKQNSAGTATENQGCAGGTTASDGRSEDHAGGGGGAGAVGGSVATATGAQSSGAGGIGREISITGEPIYYAGGGGGGGIISFVNDGYGSAGAGGAGGGGSGGQKAATDESAIASSGTDGLGGGGGGGSTHSVATYKGGNGGSGVVVIRYGAGGDGDGVVNPTISLTGLTYDDGTGDATVTYRVGWAGDGCQRADVSAIWGFHEDDLDNTNAVSAAPAIGQGTGSFALPRVSKTVYVRLLATNNGGYTGVSPEVKTLVLFNPAAPIATVSASQTLGSANAGVSKADLEADVTNLGNGATEVNGVFQICHDKFFDEGTYTTFAVTNGPITAPGILKGGATGLIASTVYWVRAVLTNDVQTAGEPTVYETDPVSFTTAQAGWPYGWFLPSNDNPEFTVTTNSISATFHFRNLGEGAASGSAWMEVSTTHDVKVDNVYTERFYTGFVAGSTTTNTVVAADIPADSNFTVEGLEPGTTYYVRYRVKNNDGRETSNSDAYEFQFTTLTPPPTGVMFLIY